MLTYLPIPEDTSPFDRNRIGRLREWLDNDTWRDERGALHWKSNDSTVPVDTFADALAEVPAAQQAVRDAEVSAFCAEYRCQRANHVPAAEELFEQRAAFGPGATVVDVITGQSWEV